ncbi:DNA primase large subunit-like [Ceratina calcarata]|uniref:DNA primase large subunit n=1 Tax=Ceratina calcarata TaxID=156304 RepID=A0AAJ7IR99_9HYME|nr:DNA primase large subunit-like [Ceratina calcarata]
MEYNTRRRPATNGESTSDPENIYLHDLQIYNEPPLQGTIRLADYQKLGVDRLKVLQYVESNAARTDLKAIEERKLHLSTALKKDGLKDYAHLLYGKGCSSSTDMDIACRKMDHLSHYILKLAFCQDTDREMWFIKQEVELFKLRFSSLNKEGVEKLLSKHEIDCQQVTQEEKDELREELSTSTAKITNIDTTDFYKVPFQKVTDLIRGRKVYLSKGIAYIPHIELISLFTSYFRKILIDDMDGARCCMIRISEDQRMITYYKTLNRTFCTATQVVWTTDSTPIEKLDELSKTSYPLCMRVLHEALKTNHHLKNGGRIQYGLFIKGIGVTLEDSLRFWKTEFTRKIDPEKFERNYAYTIRHTYGKAGKQTNYTPLGCPKIMNSAVGPGEYHGCPYKHMDPASLKQKLFNYGVPPATIGEIAELVKERNYHIACAAYFKAAHNQLPEKPILHPNGYFMESRAILAKKNPTENENKERLSQSGRFSDRVGTPRRIDRSIATPLRNIGTPSRNAGTPSRNAGTPSRNAGTPSRITGTPPGTAGTFSKDVVIPSTSTGDTTPLPNTMHERSSMTPVRTTKAIPKRIANDLTADEIAELINEDM